MKTIRTTAFAAILAFSAAYAQGPRQGRQAIDASRLSTISGAVTAIQMDYGVRYPSITVNQTTIKTAPVWFFLENDFEIKVGDQVSVVAAPCVDPRDPYLYALEITNTVTNSAITLRDGSGLPLWTNAGSRSKGPARTSSGSGACLAGAEIQTVSGVIEAVNAGVGIQMPTLLLKTSDGTLLTLKIGPERILLAADFELKAGDSITVRYAVSSCTADLVALAITDDTGLTLVLRSDDRKPAWQ